MKKIYAKSEEKWMKAYVLYPDASGYLCVDADATVKITKAELINAFKKGMIVDAGTDGMFKPTMLAVDTNYAAVSLIVMGTSVAEAKTFYSDGYTAG